VYIGSRYVGRYVFLENGDSDAWTPSYNFRFYNYNARVVVTDYIGRAFFNVVENFFCVFKTHQATRGVATHGRQNARV
jgi:hypothetical protein